MDRHPKVQSSEEFINDAARNGLSDAEWREIEKQMRAYLENENPRKMPARWVASYLTKNRAQLAVDVMRGFDKTSKLEQTLRLDRWWIRLLTAALTISWIAFWRIFVFVFNHVATIEQMLQHHR